MLRISNIPRTCALVLTMGGRMPAINQATVTLGCDPTVTVLITEDEGSLAFTLIGAEGAPDIDGIFFNLADDSTVSALSVFPKENDRELTGFDNEPGAVNTLSNGAQVAEGYDVGVQFGLAPSSTDGTVSEAGFTIFAENGAQLSIEDLDLNNIVAVVDSDGGEGIALTSSDAGEPSEPVIEIVEQTVQSDNFNGLSYASQSDIVQHGAGWDAVWGQLRTDGDDDGALTLETINTSDPVSLSFDARVPNAHRFEASGRYEDTLTVEVRIDGGDWVTLDEFRVNHAGTELVGSNTGQTIDAHYGTLNYEGGILDTAENTVQFRIVSDISANDEKIFIDNIEVTAQTEVVVDPNTTKVDFEAGLQSGDVVSDQFDGVTISAQRAGDSANSENDAMIFDSSRPTGGDHDLEYADKGNIIIISEDNDSSDADDNWNGGTISFDFDVPSDVTAITVLDIEERGGTIDLFNEAGDLIRTVDIPVTGDNGEAVVALNGTDVASMDVNLTGSGAVDELCYSASSDCNDYFVDYVPVPEQAVEQEEEFEIDMAY